MTNKTIELYTKDISRIKLPPISERVHQAVREKKEKCLEESEKHEIKVNKNVYMKYIFAAMLAVLVVSIPTIILLSDGYNVQKPGRPTQNSTETVSKTESEVSKSAETNKTLEVIMEKKIFGEVALTKRPEEECEMYLMNYQHGNSVYEDDYYLYNFDSDGNLVEILNTKEAIESNGYVDETTIKEKSETLFSLYFPQLMREKYDLKIQEYRDHTPAWIVDFIEGNKSEFKSKVVMTFNKYGNLYMAVFSPETNDIGNISKIQAVEIALSEIKSGKYDISNFEREDVNIKFELQSKDEVYIVTVENVPRKEDFKINFFIEIDSNNGKILNIGRMK